MKVELRNIGKKYEGNPYYTLENINLTVNNNEFCIILGPSGCGKTTLLRIIAGLSSVTKGDLLFDTKRVNNFLPKDRNIAMVFQSYALYPHMNVFKNLAFGLKMQKEKKDVILRRVQNVATILNIEGLLYKKPKELSGGQRQRVALGRAIVRKPKLFLMDEPLSNLDAKLREHMRTELVRIHRAIDTTTIYVTHDQLEAMTMATKIVLMNNQKIQQVGAPRELYEKPINLFTARFIGTPTMNVYRGKYVGDSFISNCQNIKIKLDPTDLEKLNAYQTNEIYVGIRSEDIKVVDKHESDCVGEIVNIELLGKEQELKVLISQTNLETNNAVITVPVSYTNDIGAKIYLKYTNIHIFDTKTEGRIN
ncbi:ABC transporter ATP-binding protein [Spiroplasma sp. SV19]|uniref:ABC transporter ATP-binding protein n=1 Tax=Spiroplasma sp. SV19 TaxID=2570468 RepID=UPI0024B7AA2C|nr:ABC transporter ATP-binding protein [Spiroplasma sp. SV19]WHQ37352.1 ATP-binding cassette domain-containing protein [Spiroplasma sp. SV19]